MQKIVIKNFGPITEAEIELKKSVVLIGEQASGKSTIAKLIYYFKSLREDWFNKIYQQSFETDHFTFAYDEFLIFPAIGKFYDFFGLPLLFHQRDFDIKFYYSIEQNKYLELTGGGNNELFLQFSDEFQLERLGRTVQDIRSLLPKNINNKNTSEVLAYNQEKLRYAERLSKLLKDTFCCKQDDKLFIVAGRNATAGYSEFFEKHFYAQLQNKEPDQKRRQTIDETLMLDFMERVVRMKEIFKNTLGFKDFLSLYSNDSKSKEMEIVIHKINEILKGQYQQTSSGERIEFNSQTADYVRLSDASSGQQEVIRILQDVFLSIVRKRKVLRIVEEPEAHLFPLAQKRVVELLVQMAKSDENNQVLVTTHSPYVLTVFNNLLFAQRVIDKNPGLEQEVSEIVGQEVRLSSLDFSAYVLGANEAGAIIAKSIVDESTGMIEQNYLDTVSEILANEFNSLYEIHAKTFGRQ